MGYNPNYRGNHSKASSRQIETNYMNATGALLPQTSVVSTNINGQIVVIDITDDTSVSRLVGLTSMDLPIAATGGVVAAGRVENITTPFNVGDPIWVNTDGTLTNVRPDYGVGAFAAGYYIIFIGVLVKNEFNPSQIDIQINPSVVGQL